MSTSSELLKGRRVSFTSLTQQLVQDQALGHYKGFSKVNLIDLYLSILCLFMYKIIKIWWGKEISTLKDQL